ncbi:MAG: hypothetical protein ABSA65_05400 [Acidimicrobiales bacterium]|jgi:hypothetical protein
MACSNADNTWHARRLCTPLRALELYWRVDRAPAGEPLAQMPADLVPLLRCNDELEFTDTQAAPLMKMSAATITACKG